MNRRDTPITFNLIAKYLTLITTVVLLIMYIVHTSERVNAHEEMILKNSNDINEIKKDLSDINKSLASISANLNNACENMALIRNDITKINDRLMNK